MIENLVDTAIASLLSTISGLKVVVGMEDNEPALTTPYCVVYSVVQTTEGTVVIYELLTVIEYNSISGQNEVADVETTMSAIDALLNSHPALSDTGLQFIGWQGIDRTQQNVGDRRRNLRELKVIAS